jgi:hypothetical protein
MIVFPLVAALIALACAAFVGRDAWRRPRPERVAWTIAFAVFAIAAGAEVLGAALGWNATLARVYYLTGAVLVVGILALGELYLLAPERMPAIAPGLALLVAAISATVVWSAPIDQARLQGEGWGAIERGPVLIALAASINAGGTLVLALGALYSAWKLRVVGGLRNRAIGCILIALGTVVVATGGTLTRFGHREYLYLAMAAGVAIIFLGVLMTRSAWGARRRRKTSVPETVASAAPSARLIPLPERQGIGRVDVGIAFVVDRLLPLDAEQIAERCRRWSATPVVADALTREQARDVWDLRLLLPDDARDRFDRLPLPLQAQIGELYRDVWSRAPRDAANARHA